ncbi:biotin carboxylase [bacterium]|nr:biotin carboxylase [bacterium]
MFSRILVANRGEIAMRVMRTCRRMGIRTVAVFSEADRDAPFVGFADEAYEIGPPLASESYLQVAKIIAVAKEHGCDAVHPGYGFLSENANFVEAAERAGIVFIGPTATSMRTLENKHEARRCMAEAGLNVIPASDDHLADDAAAIAQAEKIGYPVMVKASYGGGGIGMTIVEKPGELLSAVRRASSRAQRAFHHGDVYLEKVIKGPHHIEYQVLADHHDNVAVLFERECSVQRRNQKVIEETPSTFLTDELRNDMTRRIRESARAVGYRNAGTWECLVDKDRGWYFLEVNKRVQVEHPITEMVTGLDIVEQQIRIAAGEALSDAVMNPASNGHAIEARIYAENPAKNFMPAPGRITYLSLPREEAGVRIDSGVEEGSEVSPYYDPLLMKVCAHGADRPQAIQRLVRVLSNLSIEGLVTNREFCARILTHPAFEAGGYTTHFIEENIVKLTEGLS